MATLNLSFTQQDIAEAQKGGDFAPIPAGTYIAEINRSEVKPTKRGDGSYLSLGFKILDGEFAGRLIFQNINLSNPNQVAAQIGREQMSQLAGACYLLNVGDSQELHGIPMQIRVAINIDKSGQYEPSNEIKKFMPLQSAGFLAPSAPTAQAPVANNGFAPPPAQSAPTQPKAQPWARG